MDIDTWVILIALVVTVVGGVVGLYWGLKREIRTETGKVHTELKGDIAGLDAKIDGARTELKGDIAGLRTELKGDIAGLKTELKGDIAGLKKDVDRLDDRVYALAAGLRPYLEESQTRSG